VPEPSSAAIFLIAAGLVLVARRFAPGRASARAR
jgi:hypothetical protein